MTAPIKGTRQALFSIGGVEFAQNMGLLEASLHFYAGAYNSMAYYSTGPGGGRFTELTSKYFIHQCQQWMLGVGKTKLILPSTFYDYHKTYKAFKKRNGIGVGKTEPHMLSGKLASSLTIINMTGGGRTVGIHKSAMASRRGGAPVSVNYYAGILEWGGPGGKAESGTGHKPRPFFQEAMKEFTRQNLPEMQGAVEQAIVNLAKKNEKKLYVKSEGMGYSGNTTSSASMAAMEHIGNANYDTVYKSLASEVVAGSGSGGGIRTRFASLETGIKANEKQLAIEAKRKGIPLEVLQKQIAELKEMGF